MNTTIQILPGVKALYWLECRKLQRRVDLLSIQNVPVTILTDLHQIEFFGMPHCSRSSIYDNGGCREEASLKFSCATMLPKHRMLGFVVTDVVGNNFLIGAKENPRPIVKANLTCGDPDNETAAIAYEVSHVAIRTLIPCKI